MDGSEFVFGVSVATGGIMISHSAQLLLVIWSTFAEMAPYLLLGLIFAGILHVSFSKDFIARHLGADTFGSVVKAALLGVPLPLCSCGVIPTALSLRKSRASEGAVMSFLISTPQTGVDSIIATWGMLGPVFAIFRPIAALLMGILGGISVRLRKQGGRGIEADDKPNTVGDDCVVCNTAGVHSHGLFEKVTAMIRYAFGTFLDDISVQLVVGIVLSGLISYFVPADFFQKFVTNDFAGMAIMIVVGMPLYVCATASIPIAAALMMKGLSPGAAFVFLAVGPVTNAASMLLITRSMGKRFMGFYLASTIVGAVLAGMALNAFFSLTGVDYVSVVAHAHHHQQNAGGVVSWLSRVGLYLFIIAFAVSLTRKAFPGVLYRLKQRGVNAPDGDIYTLGIEGMTCSHCAAHVRQALEGVKGVTTVRVDLARKQAVIRGGETGALKDAVRQAGYKTL